MKKTAFLFIIIYTLSFPQAKLPDSFYKRLEGKIGSDMNVVLNIVKADTQVTGSYYYLKTGEPIRFDYFSRMSGDSIYMPERTEEYDANYNPVYSGALKGVFTQDGKMQGEWLNQKSGKSYPFLFSEEYPEGSAKFDYVYKRSGLDTSVTIDIAFPVMKDFADKKVQDSINAQIAAIIMSDWTEENVSYNNVDERAEAFVQRYKDEVLSADDLPEDYHPQYSDYAQTDIDFNSDYIISFRITQMIYTGGAHPSTYISLFSSSLKDGNKITLNDIFKPGYENALDELGEKYLKKKMDIPEADSLQQHGFYFEGCFHLNDNFSLTKGGIVFLFNQYEIAPYVMGAPELFIPYTELKSLLKENSPVAGIK